MQQNPDGLLIGCGFMALTYVPIFRHLGLKLKVMGRGDESANRFRESTGLEVGTGPLDQQLAQLDFEPRFAVVAVDVVQLASVTSQLINHGIRRILLEKPGGINPAEISRLNELATAKGAEVYIAYNRRFFSSVRKARELVEQDGGVVSSKFDFTELTSRIPLDAKDPRELRNFFFANSTHVLDLHTYLCGDIQDVNAFAGGSLAWHPGGSIFTGHGRTDRGTVFSYHANWESPGRWQLELMTRKRRLVLTPLEELSQQLPDSFRLLPVSVDGEVDPTFKPGIHRMVEAFLAGDSEQLPLLSAQSLRVSGYQQLLRPYE